MQWVSIVMLLLTLWPFRISAGPLLLALVVCASGVLLVRQAIFAGKYSWAVVFVAMAVLFNPVLPIARSASTVLWANTLGLATFLTAAVALRPERRLTVLSIVNGLPRRESL
jgi:hypothetical protein